MMGYSTWPVNRWEGIMPESKFELEPNSVQPTLIKVVGVGGAGCNVINRMVDAGVKHVEFIAVNTDLQVLAQSKADLKIQIGTKTTRGLGAGAQPEVGRKAAEEDIEEIKNRLKGADMVFITAGMGGGTGTGASPIIARVASEMQALTIAVVTKPFNFEQPKRMRHAQAGIDELYKYVDSMICIPNQNLLKMADKKFTFRNAFSLADSVLLQGVRGISDVIQRTGTINADFMDVKTTMASKGYAVLGMAEAHTEQDINEVVERVIHNPLIENTHIEGAKGMLVNITHGPDAPLFFVTEVAEAITKRAQHNIADVIVGTVEDETMDQQVKFTVIATGFDNESGELSPGRGEVEMETERENEEHEESRSRTITLMSAEDEEEEPEVIERPFKGDFGQYSDGEDDLPPFLRQKMS